MEKKIYFASDTHFGARSMQNPIEYERRFVRWLGSIKDSAEALYLLGDMIDFWFEYKTVVPRGFTRFFGKLSELSDAGVEIHWFTGNHDLWMTDYLEKEIGMVIHRRALSTNIRGKRFLLAHGDEFGDPKDYKFRFIRWLFHSKLCRMALATVHPRWTVAFAHGWSKESRKKGPKYTGFLGEEKEYLVRYAKKSLRENEIDLFVFGHRHLPLDLMLSHHSRIIILGDWIEHFTYGVLDNKGFTLETYEA